MNRKTLIQLAHLGKQIVCFIRLFAGAQIKTSVVIQFVRLVASFTSLEKSSELQQEVYPLKMILLSCLFKAL